MVEVDPSILRAFAQQTASTADSIDANGLRGRVIAAFAGMAGSTSAYSAQGVDAFAAARVTDLAQGFDALASAARGSGTAYEVSDDELAGAIAAVFQK